MAKPQKIAGLKPHHSYRENARIILPQKLEEVYTWEGFIRDPDRHDELHNMRISMKRLRYTMEFFAVNYDSQFTALIDTITELQDILGDIHDSDVILEILTQFEEKHKPTGLPGVHTLIDRTRETRNTDYQKFLNKWEQLSASDFKQKLLAIFTS